MDTAIAIRRKSSSSSSDNESILLDNPKAKQINRLEKLYKPLGLVVANPLKALGAFSGSYVLLYLLWSMFWLAAAVLTIPGACATFSFGSYAMLGRISASMTYPGQHGFAQAIVVGCCNSLLLRRLMYFSECFSKLNEILGKCTIREFFVEQFENADYAFQEYVAPVHAALSLQQSTCVAEDTKLRFIPVLEDICKQYASLQCSLTELCRTSAYNFEDVKIKVFADGTDSKDQLSKLVQSTKQMDEYIIEQLQAPSFKERVLTFISTRKLQKSRVVTFNYLRAELVARYNAETISILGPNKNTIDARLVPCARDAHLDRKVVIMCNSNGGFLETFYYMTRWIEFYHKEGFDLLLYNYRGYCKSEGAPSPERNNEDGVAVVKYLKEIKKYGTIGIHGHSIGGLVATYIANACDEIRFLVADRTFSNIPALTQRLLGKWVGKLLPYISKWDTDNVQNYLAFQGTKIICHNPYDEVIHDPSSLKSGIALAMELQDYDGWKINAVSDFTSEATFNESSIAQFYTAIVQLHDISLQSLEYSEVFTLFDIQGACGQLLSDELHRGFDYVRSFLCSLVTFGPTTLPKILTTLQTIIDALDEVNNNNEKVSDPLHIVHEMYKTIRKRIESIQENESKHKKSIGHLIPLSVGHEESFSTHEEDALSQILQNANIY